MKKEIIEIIIMLKNDLKKYLVLYLIQQKTRIIRKIIINLLIIFLVIWFWNYREEDLIWFLEELFDIIMIIGLYASSIYIKVIYLLDWMEYIYWILYLDEYGRIFLYCYMVIFWIIYICYLIYEIKLLIEKIKLWYKIYIKKKV